MSRPPFSLVLRGARSHSSHSSALTWQRRSEQTPVDRKRKKGVNRFHIIILILFYECVSELYNLISVVSGPHIPGLFPHWLFYITAEVLCAEFDLSAFVCVCVCR